MVGQQMLRSSFQQDRLLRGGLAVGTTLSYTYLFPCSVSCSKYWAKLKSWTSPKALVMICRPMGRLFLSVPLGIDMAGKPAIEASVVYTSAQYMSTGSWTWLPSLKAVVGVVGKIIKSYVDKIAWSCC
jgi:hypothetical protein